MVAQNSIVSFSALNKIVSFRFILLVFTITAFSFYLGFGQVDDDNANEVTFPESERNLDP